VLPRLGKKDCEILKLAVEKCDPNPITERELPLLGHKRAIAAVRTLSKVCGYGTTTIHATLKKLMADCGVGDQSGDHSSKSKTR
jgi:hypothetical protein